MNINHEPVATRLMIDIKHQPERVLFDTGYQTCASPAPGGQGELQRCARATCSSPAPRWAGEAPAAPERSVRPRPPRWVGGLQLRARVSCAPSEQEEPAACQSSIRDPGNQCAGRASAANQNGVHPPAPAWQGAPVACQSILCAPAHTPRVNEYQS